MAKHKQAVRVEVPEVALRDAQSTVVELAEEMRSWADSLEERLSHTEKYQAVSAAADTLEGVDSLDDMVDQLASLFAAVVEASEKFDAENARPQLRFGQMLPLGEEKTPWVEAVPYKGRTLSRASRLDNALEGVRSALGSLDHQVIERLGRLGEVRDTFQATEEPEALEEVSDALDEIQGLLDEVRSVLDELEGVEFPGMY